MYAKHFITMLLGLVLMAAIGLGFLVWVNYSNHRDPLAGITPAVTNGSSSKATVHSK
ncbi:MAG: hypothetical protein WCO65_03560 [bacterium]